ncbi:MAG: DUF1934 domain-containing protein [Ruminococcus sp.]|nr:DUF1934 domain-containing protein [Ruminococcus sp.]MCD8188186.1 DUF1934 domain-containing protein [Ruminococcus sp.]
MENNVIISLMSIQWQNGEKSETELITKANCRIDDDCSVISYEDTPATGFEGSTTTIKTDGKTASIVRSGTANSSLNLEKEKKHFCQYGTPYGMLQIGVFTHLIEDNLQKDGSLRLKYTLDLNSSYLSDNEIILKIKNSDITN